MGSLIRGKGLSISDTYLRRSVKNLNETIRNKVTKDIHMVFKEASEVLKIVSPKDTTTRKDREIARKNGEIIPFEKHGNRSADSYSYQVYKTSTGKSIKGKILNDYAYILYLDQGKMDETGLLIGARSRERTMDGKYSEQQPEGDFINKTLKVVFLKYGYHIDKSKFKEIII